VFPRKTDPPLVIYPDAVLSGPVSRQLFQSISRSRSEIAELHGAIEHNQLTLRRLLEA
jgi:hypothetical protein